jgi:hypothetical protein
LNNIRELRIGFLDIPSFIPAIRKYFDHFLPTVRSLALESPKGSRRQIIFFIGLFQDLQNLSIYDNAFSHSGGQPEDLTLVPSFSPPLRGRLVAWRVKRGGLFRDMAGLFGGIKFSQMNLLDVEETEFLLTACSKTLWTLQLHPTDPRGE